MKHISIDIETYSSVDLTECGVYRYSESPDFEVLLFGYSADGGEVKVVDTANGEQLPAEILSALNDDGVIKWAFNANFERVCLSRLLGVTLDPASWRCTMVWSMYLGLPHTLKQVGEVLNLKDRKLEEGGDMIKIFSLPDKYGRRTNPQTLPAQWEKFKSYNKRDVEVELAIQRCLAGFPVPDSVWQEYAMDQRINDRGIAIDPTLVNNAITLDEQAKSVLGERMKEITGLENPNSIVQLKKWLGDRGLQMPSLGKKEVAAALKTVSGEAAEVLRLRQQSGKSSVSKYTAMKKSVCADGRIRGMFRFYGARTGRWTSKIVQLQNLPQNHLPDLKQARELVTSNNREALEMLYENIPDTLSQLIRTAFTPKEGKKFVVADFAAIEARVIAWLAGESWRQKAFAEGADIYCASASKMFGVPVEKHGVNGHLRQKGKIAELALGYGGSVGALTSMGALEMGLSEDELLPLVESWREANPAITALWYGVGAAAKQAISERGTAQAYGLKFEYKSGFLFIELPSKRRLAYVKPQIGGKGITYWGVSGKDWKQLESYGAKLVENIVQAISRDLLVNAMKNLRGYDIVAHVHDELIIECDKSVSLEKICGEMAKAPVWAEAASKAEADPKTKGLILRADGYECEFYRKD